MEIRNENNKMMDKTLRHFTTLLICLGIMASGCKDFLKPDPASFSSSGNYYTNPAEFEAALNSAYSRMRNYRDLQGSWGFIVENRLDEAQRNFDQNLPGVSQEPMDEWNYTPDNNIPRGVWNGIYETIAQTNTILTRISPDMFDDATQYDQIIGQAEFIRGLAYFDAVQLWGEGQDALALDSLGVPLVTKENASPADALTGKARATNKAVLDQIVSDATDAASKLPDAWAGSPGRATAGAANTLLGETDMLYDSTPQNKGDNGTKLGEALTAFMKVVNSGQYTLLGDYRSVFDPQNINNAESVFELQYSNTIADQPDAGIVDNTLPLDSRGILAPSIVNPSSNAILPSYEAVHTYSPGDMRFDATVGKWHDTDPQFIEDINYWPNDTVVYNKKYLWPSDINASGQQAGDIYVWRYADVLLDISEVYWRMGNDGQALNYLNMIHGNARTGLSDITDVTDTTQVMPNHLILDGTYMQVGGDDMARAIFNERTVELWCEGHRMYDLRRFNVAYKALLNYAASRKSRETRIDNLYFVDRYEIVMPISPDEIAASGGDIQQNPGW